MENVYPSSITGKYPGKNGHQENGSNLLGSFWKKIPHKYQENIKEILEKYQGNKALGCTGMCQ